jgi:hypothetical protein
MDDDLNLTEGGTSPAPSRPFPWLLVIVILVAGYLYFSRQNNQPKPPPDDQSIVIVDDERRTNPQPAPVNLQGSTLVFVLEALSVTAQQQEVMLSVTTDGLRGRGMEGFRRYDDDQSEVQELVSFAVSKNTPSPFVALLKDKKILKLAPFPTTSAELEAFLR